MSAHTEQDSPTSRRWICVSNTERWVIHQELRQLKGGGGEAWVCAHFDKPEKIAPRPA